LGKVSVVPIGLSDRRFPQPAQVALMARLRGRWRHLVFALGRMTYYKGFEVLVEAARWLPEDCGVIIGGQGERLEALRRQASQAGLQDRVLFPGHIPDDDLASYFEACDVFCVPSTQRAEDIAGSGVPWVNQHGRTGLNVPVGDARALAAALCRLLADDGLREEFAGGARRRHEEEFSAGRMIQRVLALYHQLPARR
jgi:rhamnosyl/mannosyltransferase